jgi:hypothetical protein
MPISADLEPILSLSFRSVTRWPECWSFHVNLLSIVQQRNSGDRADSGLVKNFARCIGDRDGSYFFQTTSLRIFFR